MKFRWTMAPSQPVLCKYLSGELGISTILAQCLLNRGLSEPQPIRHFLEPRLKYLADPFLIPGMASAVGRLQQARESGEALVIFGDYDVDGVSATALLYEVFGDLGLKAHYFLPQRLEEGYGLTRPAIEKCLAQYPVRLVLAVDCGSTAVEAISWLRDQGLDVLVLDHHQVPDPAPPASVIINPQLGAAENAPFRELCSVGLAFKLAHALVKAGRQQRRQPEEDYDLRPLLDLVALGTIADLVPLTGENRILVSAGLEWLNLRRRPGLESLCRVAQTGSPLGGYEVGFQLAPRLNAAGRLEDALASLQLLLAPDVATAEPIALQLDAQNRQRQAIERDILNQVLSAVRSRFDPERDFVIVEGNATWHLGVVGIVASRILHEFYRPTIILGGDTSGWRGSGRSIDGFDLAAALRQCGDLLDRHGGHAMAAGLSIPPENLGALRQRLNDLARQCLTTQHLQPSLRLDADVRLEDLTLERVQELGRLQQTGIGNPPVQFAIRGLTQSRPLQRVGADKQHVKLWVTDGVSLCEAMWWGAGQETSLPVGRFDLAFSPKINRYQNSMAVLLTVLDWRPSE